MTDVCCALIIDSGKYLAVKRGLFCKNQLKWELPGGKVLENETPENCIAREIFEELNVDIEVLRKLIPVEFDYGNKLIKLIPFECKIISGKLKLTEHIESAWFDIADYKLFDWLKADIDLIKTNYQLLNKRII